MSNSILKISYIHNFGFKVKCMNAYVLTTLTNHEIYIFSLLRTLDNP